MSHVDRSLGGSRYSRQLRAGFAGLRFDPPLEQEFRRKQIAGGDQRRRPLICALGLLCVLWMLDAQSLPESGAWLANGARAASLGALLLALLATYPGALARHAGHLALVAALCLTLAGAVMVALVEKQAITAVLAQCLIFTLCIHFLMGLRFAVALLVAVPIPVVLLIFREPWQETESLYGLMALAAANVIGSLAVYRAEHAERSAFLLREALHLVAGTDALTGIPNRKMMELHLRRVWRQACREGKNIALLLIELDFFEEYRVRYGQSAGDAALRRVAHAVMGCARRPLDYVARFSDVRMAVVLFGPKLEDLQAVCARVQAQVALLDIPHADPRAKGRMTVSVGAGIAEGASALDTEDLLAAAERALDEPDGGRNRVCICKAGGDDDTRSISSVLLGPWKSTAS